MTKLLSKNAISSPNLLKKYDICIGYDILWSRDYGDQTDGGRWTLSCSGRRMLFLKTGL